MTQHLKTEPLSLLVITPVSCLCQLNGEFCIYHNKPNITVHNTEQLNSYSIAYYVEKNSSITNYPLKHTAETLPSDLL